MAQPKKNANNEGTICLRKEGPDARMIMEVLGHSSIRVTLDIYTFVGSTRSALPSTG
ncbi:hypothetical protein [Streptomyces sp. Root1310]|uniref:hypothetical protein n=1 Tax=Streptomyces sp. Root1310 TaxID=1736452 RepID=UPI000AA34F44|nr:hypothetical protein [Streptomyces sp. Root1310]